MVLRRAGDQYKANHCEGVELKIPLPPLSSSPLSTRSALCISISVSATPKADSEFTNSLRELCLRLVFANTFVRNIQKQWSENCPEVLSKNLIVFVVSIESSVTEERRR